MADRVRVSWSHHTDRHAACVSQSYKFLQGAVVSINTVFVINSASNSNAFQWCFDAPKMTRTSFLWRYISSLSVDRLAEGKDLGPLFNPIFKGVRSSGILIHVWKLCGEWIAKNVAIQKTMRMTTEGMFGDECQRRLLNKLYLSRCAMLVSSIDWY